MIARSFVTLVAGTPARLMVAVWAIALVIYFLGPIQYYPAPGLFTWAFVAACLFAFIVGSVAGRARRIPRIALATQRTVPVFDRRIDRMVRLTALIGLIGIMSLAVDKLLLSGLDYSQGITALRFARALEVDLGTARELRRSPFLYIGYLTCAFSVASFLLYLFQGEALRRTTIRWAHVALLSPVVYSILYGGRSPIGLVIGVALGAVIVRLLGRDTALPSKKTGRVLLVGFVLFSVIYSGYVFTERRLFSGAQGFTEVSERLATVYDADVSPWVGRVIERHPATRDLVLNLLLTHYYFTHEVPMLDRTLRYEGALGPYYGSYQFYLASALVGRLVPALSIEEQMITESRAANIYGWFSGAWGGMYLDFGMLGALLAVFACGWVSGRIYRRALADNDLRAKLIMSYVVAGIIASPILSIFTVSISLPILVAIVITARFVRRIPSLSLQTLPRQRNSPESVRA